MALDAKTQEKLEQHFRRLGAMHKINATEINSADRRRAANAIDDWLESVDNNVKSALPQPFAARASESEIKLMLAIVAANRAGIGI